jgi:predicted nucleic acid-binding protein
VIAVDTSVWIDFFAGRSSPQVEYLSGCIEFGYEEIALTDIVLAEILQGLSTDRDVDRVEDRLSVFEVLLLRSLADFRKAASLYRTARRKGITVRRTSDCLIAAVCIRENVPMLHADSDFDHLASATELAVVRVSGD